MMILPDVEPTKKETDALPATEKKALSGTLSAAQITERLENILGIRTTGEEMRKASLRRLNTAISALQDLHDDDMAESETIDKVRSLIADLEKMRGWMYRDMVDWDEIARSDKA